MKKNRETKIVCLGGGVGTVNLLLGLKRFTNKITVIVSMADDGGSAGRLRRLYNMLPVGDLVSCMAAMARDDTKLTAELLRYRFSGERYGKDTELGGHKLGNLIMVALKDLTGNYEDAIEVFKKMFDVQGEFLPATKGQVTISAKTIEGKEIHGEETIDLGKYEGEQILEKVFLHPANARPGDRVKESILSADAIVLGPGDLYTNLLPVIIVPEIAKALEQTNAKRMFVVNVANKPFETKNYKVQDYIDAVKRHVKDFPFDTVFVNNNFAVTIPDKYSYTYVTDGSLEKDEYTIVEQDFVNQKFPLYHNSEKLANAVWEQI